MSTSPWPSPQDPASRAPAARVAGVVRNVAGHPIVGAEVTVLPQDVTTLTGSQGEFALMLPAGRVSLHIRADGFTDAVVESLDLVPGATWRREVRLASAPRSAGGWGASLTGHRASLA